MKPALEFNSLTGAKVVIVPASFQDANELKLAILREDGTGKFNINTVDTAPLILKAIWPCLERCTYNANKITPDIFEDVAARKDYYQVINACVAENMRPFMEGLIAVSPLSESLKNTKTQKSK